MKHDPVLLQEVLDLANPLPGQTILDGTLGLGGYTAAFAQKVGPTGSVVSIELDSRNLVEASERLAPYTNVTLVQDNFRHTRNILLDLRKQGINAAIFDLGLSSPHVDDAQRGFSYKLDGPLDMRFSTDTPVTAADIVNDSDARTLETILRKYGEEPQAKRIVASIEAQRTKHPITTTHQLVECINNSIREDLRSQTIKRVFQALRIAVNDEMEALREGLQGAFDSLAPQGKLLVVSYHSLEDAIVKDFFRSLTATCICPKESPVCTCHHPLAQDLTRKPVTPGPLELTTNPRSRSAKLRSILKL